MGYKRPFGAHQRYFILSGAKSEQPLGCLLFSVAAWALAVHDEWIGWTQADRSQRLNLVLNNTRFLIFPWVRVRNLASKALSVAAKRLRSDRQDRYGYRPVYAKSAFETVEQEQEERQTVVEEHLKVLWTLLPGLLARLSRIKDPR